MSVQPVAWPEPDPQVVAAIGAKYRGRRPRPLAVLVRDRLGEWLGDEDFAAAFGVRCRPGWFPSRLVLVTVLQRAENLTDRQAAESVRTRIDWETWPFGDEVAVFKVAGKMFALLPVDADPPEISLKCDPTLAAARLPPQQAALEHGDAGRVG